VPFQEIVFMKPYLPLNRLASFFVMTGSDRTARMAAKTSSTDDMYIWCELGVAAKDRVSTVVQLYVKDSKIQRYVN